MRKSLYSLVVLVLAFTGLAWPADEFAWIQALPGVSLATSEARQGRYEAVYTVGDLAGTLSRVRSGLEQRGWTIERAGSAATEGGLQVQGFRAHKDGRLADVTVQNAFGIRTLALDVKGGGGGSSGQVVVAPGVSVGGASVGEKLVINDSGAAQTYHCQGTKVVINGSSCSLTLTGSVSRLVVNGSANTVKIPGSIEEIQLNGSSNTVSWSRASNPTAPDVNSLGAGNSVAEY